MSGLMRLKSDFPAAQAQPCRSADDGAPLACAQVNNGARKKSEYRACV